MHDEAAENVHRVAPALDEAEGIVQRGVGVAPAQALAEGGQDVVIGVLIVGERFALNGLLRIGESDVNAPVGGGGVVRTASSSALYAARKSPRSSARCAQSPLYPPAPCMRTAPCAR